MNWIFRPVCVSVYHVQSTLCDFCHDFALLDRFQELHKISLIVGQNRQPWIAWCDKLTDGGLIAWWVSDAFRHSPAAWRLLRWWSNEETTGAHQLTECLWPLCIFFLLFSKHWQYWQKTCLGYCVSISVLLDLWPKHSQSTIVNHEQSLR